MKITESKLRKIIRQELLREMDYMTAVKKAKEISKKEGVVQHVNKISNDRYEVSDWYDEDTTQISFENGGIAGHYSYGNHGRGGR